MERMQIGYLIGYIIIYLHMKFDMQLHMKMNPPGFRTSKHDDNQQLIFYCHWSISYFYIPNRSIHDACHEKIELFGVQNFGNFWVLRILAIDDPKISQKLAFLGYWHKCIHGTPSHSENNFTGWYTREPVHQESLFITQLWTPKRYIFSCHESHFL